MVHKAEAVIKKDERKNISEGLRFAIIEGQVASELSSASGYKYIADKKIKVNFLAEFPKRLSR